MIFNSAGVRAKHAYATMIGVWIFVAGLLHAPVFATTPEPHELVRDVVARVMDRIDTEIAPDASSSDALLALFEQELSPHFAFTTISRWIAGRRWTDLSAAEQAELEAVVHDHIVHVYASLLARGHSARITIDPSSTIGGKSARVSGMLAVPGNRDVNLEFRLLRGATDWKLYDLSVDGLSFARSLKAELQPVLEADGITGLRAYLARYQ